MNELSCMKLRFLVAARPGPTPNKAPAPPTPAIFSTSRRVAARVIEAIPNALPMPRCLLQRRPGCRRLTLGWGNPRSQRGASSLFGLPCAILPQQELTPYFDQWHTIILDDIGGCIRLVPGIRDEAAGTHDVDRRLRIRH